MDYNFSALFTEEPKFEFGHAFNSSPPLIKMLSVIYS